MPTYEYACKDCGEHLEVVQSFKDEPLTECPTCDGSLRKVFSAAGIIFKGSGWHVKDYAQPKRTARRTSGTDTDADAASASKTTDTAAPASGDTSTTSTASTDTAAASTSTSSEKQSA